MCVQPGSGQVLLVCILIMFCMEMPWADVLLKKEDSGVRVVVFCQYLKSALHWFGSDKIHVLSLGDGILTHGRAVKMPRVVRSRR